MVVKEEASILGVLIHFFEIVKGIFIEFALNLDNALGSIDILANASSRMKHH